MHHLLSPKLAVPPLDFTSSSSLFRGMTVRLFIFLFPFCQLPPTPHSPQFQFKVGEKKLQKVSSHIIFAKKNFHTIFDSCEETKRDIIVCAPNSSEKKREKTFSTYRIVCNLYLIFFLLFCYPGEAERFKIRKLLSLFFFMILILCWAKVDIKVGNIWGKFFRTYSALVFGWKQEGICQHAKRKRRANPYFSFFLHFFRGKTRQEGRGKEKKQEMNSEIAFGEGKRRCVCLWNLGHPKKIRNKPLFFLTYLQNLFCDVATKVLLNSPPTLNSSVDGKRGVFSCAKILARHSSSS